MSGETQTEAEPRTVAEAQIALRRRCLEGYRELTGGVPDKEGHLTGGHFVLRKGQDVRWHEHEAGRMLLLRREYQAGKYAPAPPPPQALRRIPLSRRWEARHLVTLAEWVAATGVGQRQAAQLREAVGQALLHGSIAELTSDCIAPAYDPLEEADAHNQGLAFWYFTPSGGLEYSLPSDTAPPPSAR